MGNNCGKGNPKTFEFPGNFDVPLDDNSNVQTTTYPNSAPKNSFLQQKNSKQTLVKSRNTKKIKISRTKKKMTLSRQVNAKVLPKEQSSEEQIIQQVQAPKQLLNDYLTKSQKLLETEEYVEKTSAMMVALVGDKTSWFHQKTLWFSIADNTDYGYNHTEKIRKDLYDRLKQISWGWGQEDNNQVRLVVTREMKGSQNDSNTHLLKVFAYEPFHPLRLSAVDGTRCVAKLDVDAKKHVSLWNFKLDDLEKSSLEVAKIIAPSVSDS